MKKYLFLLFLLLMPAAFAQRGTIKLLAVTDGNKQGTVVDLNLDIIDGSGRVFIETYPLSQIDTQISLRIGKTIACKISENYCLNKDFIYSLQTNSPIVAGPSAGAAITLLTIASLENKKIDSYTVITGTINSGGVVGVVGGAREKIKAAVDAGLKRILIPKGEENATGLIAFGKELNVSVIEVSDVEEAYEIFTNTKKVYPPLVPDATYVSIMKDLNENICKRTETIQNTIDVKKIPEDAKGIYEQGSNLSQKAAELSKEGKYYSSASRCFGANVYFRQVIFKIQNISHAEIETELLQTTAQLDELETGLNNTKLTRLGDLEAAMIVQERIIDARENIKEARERNSTSDLSYAIERTYSASAWLRFMGFAGKQIDESKLKDSCMLKINEVEELYNYIQIYIPHLVDESKKGLESAKQYLNSSDYALCLFKASKSEAEISSALSTIYIADENVNDLLDNKIIAAKKAIQKQIEKGTFPILGYSYYEYADVLKENEKYTALLYAEYGIELSNLDIYFPQKKPFGVNIDTRALLTFVLGLFIGSILFSMRKQRRTHIQFRR